jgi:hypothetical protein
MAVDNKRKRIENLPVRLKEVTTPATPPSGFIEVYSEADSLLYCKNSGGYETQIDGSITKWKTADQSSSSTAYVNDTHLQFPVDIGTYIVNGTLFGFSAATTTGQKISFNGPTTSQIRYSVLFQTAASTMTLVGAIVYDSPNTVSGSIASNTGLLPSVNLVSGFFIFTAAGTLSLRIASEIAAQTTFEAYSFLTLKRVG